MSDLSLVSYRCLGSALVASFLCFFVGCDEDGGGNYAPPSSSGGDPEQETGPKIVSSEGLPALAPPMPVQDEGRIIIAGPEDWIRASRSRKYLARFFRTRDSEMPYIIMFLDENDDLPFRTVTTANLEEFSDAMRATVNDSVEQVKPMIIGDRPVVRYVSPGDLRDGTRIERVTLVTLVDGRLYRLELRILPGEDAIRFYQPKLYAMMAGLRFPRAGVSSEEDDAANESDASDSPEDEEEENNPPDEDNNDGG